MNNPITISSGHRGMNIESSAGHSTAEENLTQSQKSTSITYSSVVNKQQFPSRKQAIVFNTIEDVPTFEYTLAVGKQIGPKNIRYASKISNNRVCIYLSSEESVNTYMSSFGSIKIANQIIPGRRLITPAQRLILSNVSPTIPHDVLENELKKMGLNIVSSMNFLRMNIPDPEYSHVMSFRRHIYVSPQDLINIPESLLVEFDDTQYRIFLSVDNASCFNCKKTGHLASKCPLKTITDNQAIETTDIAIQEPEPQSDKPQNINIESSSRQKRPISETLTPSPEINISEITFTKPKTPKKQKAEEPITKNLNDLLITTKEIIETGTFILTYEQLLNFFDNAQKTTDTLSVAKRYTDDIDELIRMLTIIYPHINDKSMKSRCTKIRNRLSKQLTTPNSNLTSDSESDNSITH